MRVVKPVGLSVPGTLGAKHLVQMVVPAATPVRVPPAVVSRDDPAGGSFVEDTVPTADAKEQPLVDVVVPVNNEERILASSVRRLRSYLDREFPFSAVVTVVDNGSTDATSLIAARLEAELEGVHAIHLEDNGRGRALRVAWAQSEAQVVAYMDVDLSTSLDALLPLVAPLLSGHSELAIGTRLARGSRVLRGPRRELISRAYNLLLKVFLHSEFSDAQCGFKAARADVIRCLLPEVVDEDWFFDTELLVRAERHGLRIHEVPVDWVEDTDSRVDVVRTVQDDLKGMLRLRRDKTPRFVLSNVNDIVDTMLSRRDRTTAL
jgi:glycosyltransferase involved in cell wall biosynthesis